MKQGSQSIIYRKYLDFLNTFLKDYAKHDIDGDGILWCKKEEWVDFLCPYISDDDANAIGHSYCSSNARTVIKMLDLIYSGKLYICHRLYNQGFIKNIERRKEVNPDGTTGRNVIYFRSLKENEKPTPPQPDSVYLMKKVFKSFGHKEQNKYKLNPNEAYKEFVRVLNQKLFPDDDTKIREWNRVVSILEKQHCLCYKDKFYVFAPIKRGSVYRESIKKNNFL